MMLFWKKILVIELSFHNSKLKKKKKKELEW